MKIAAIYDIHGNLPALKAVYNEIRTLRLDLIIFGGDIITGPFPNETLDMLKKMSRLIPSRFILGNGESELLRFVAGEPVNGLSPMAETDARWLASILKPAHIDFLKTWEDQVTLNLDHHGKAIFCHATPANNVDVFTKRSTAQRLNSLFKDVDADLIVCGHTHMQVFHELDHLIVINAGSVGMPFGVTGANWLLLNGDEIEFRYTVYDLNKAAASVRTSDYPSAERFAMNNILNGPSEGDALDMLAKLEEKQINS